MKDDKTGARFMAAPAPMTAKCIIRDELVDALGLSAAAATDIVATIVIRLSAYEYYIEEAQDDCCEIMRE